MIDGLIAFSQQQLLRPEEKNLNDLLKLQRGGLESVLSRGVHLFIRFAPEPLIVRIDVNLFQDVLKVLTKKSEEGLGGSGTIQLKTRSLLLDRENGLMLPPGEYCGVEIIDDGPTRKWGVENLFDPFFTTGDFGTADLELAAAYGMVRQSGGQVDFCGSGPSAGNMIKVVLPRFRR